MGPPGVQWSSDVTVCDFRKEQTYVAVIDGIEDEIVNGSQSDGTGVCARS